MSEEEKTQTPQEEVKGEAKETPTQTPKEKSIIDEAREIRDDIKSQRAEFAEERRQFEELRARQMLGGQSDAGQMKLSPEQQEAAKAQKEASEIVGAFK